MLCGYTIIVWAAKTQFIPAASNSGKTLGFVSNVLPTSSGVQFPGESPYACQLCGSTKSPQATVSGVADSAQDTVPEGTNLLGVQSLKVLVFQGYIPESADVPRSTIPIVVEVSKH